MEVAWGLIPYLINIVVGLFDNGSDRVWFSYGISREIAAILGEHIRLGTNRATIDVRIKTNYMISEVQYRIGGKRLLHLPKVGIGGCFDGDEVTTQLLHGGTKHTAGVADSLVAYHLARLSEQYT